MSNNEAMRRDGYFVAPRVIDDVTVASLIAAIENTQDAIGVRRRDSVYAIRNLFDAVPAVRELARIERIRSLVEPILGLHCFAVRGILFDKTPDANWKVMWHQDLSIAVRERKNLDDFGPWTNKAGVLHVQPPTAVLEGMLTLRLNLDDDAQNGALRVLPGSHRHGKLGSADIHLRRESHDDVTCAVPRGGALLMKPLLLHASSSSRAPRHRRVIHLEFAAESLPNGLEWHCRI